MRKRITSITLAIVLCAALLPTTTLAFGSNSLYEYMFFTDLSDGVFANSRNTFMTVGGTQIDLPNGWEFRYNTMFSDGVAIVIAESDASTYNPYGYGDAKDATYTFGAIDTQGNLLFQVTASSLGDFSDGLAPINLNEKYGFIDKTGSIVVQADFDSTYSYQDGYCIIVQGDIHSFDAKYGVIDRTGNLVVHCQYRRISSCSGGFIFAYTGGAETDESMIMDMTGEIAFNDNYKPVYAGIQLQENYGFSDGMACVEKRSGGLCYIDTSGNIVFDVPVGFQPVSPFSDGRVVLAEYNNDTHETYLHVFDTKGNKVFALPQGSGVNVWYRGGGYKDGLLLVFLGDGSGGPCVYYDVDGNEVLTVSDVLIDITKFYNGYAVYWGDDDAFHILKNPLYGTTSTPNTPDSWAVTEVNAALDAGLVPDSISNAGWQNSTSRLAAAEAMVLLIEKASGKTMVQIASERRWDLSTNGFSDTSSQAVTFLKYA